MITCFIELFLHLCDLIIFRFYCFLVNLSLHDCFCQLSDHFLYIHTFIQQLGLQLFDLPLCSFLLDLRFRFLRRSDNLCIWGNRCLYVPFSGLCLGDFWFGLWLGLVDIWLFLLLLWLHHHRLWLGQIWILVRLDKIDPVIINRHSQHLVDRHFWVLQGSAGFHLENDRKFGVPYPCTAFCCKSQDLCHVSFVDHLWKVDAHCRQFVPFGSICDNLEFAFLLKPSLILFIKVELALLSDESVVDLCRRGLGI